MKASRLIFERSLIPCSMTLIVVPDALLEHWAEQIRRHLDLEVFADPNASGEGSQGVVYIDGIEGEIMLSLSIFATGTHYKYGE